MGKNAIHGAFSSVVALTEPIWISEPHVMPCETESPKNAKPPSATMATAMPKSAKALIGITTLGNNSRKMILES